MNPANFTLTGVVVLLAGFVLAGLGGGLYAQQILCNTSSVGCNLTSVESAIRSVSIFLSMLFGILLIVVGAIFTTGGHLTQHLSHRARDANEPQDLPLRMCVKCGRQVDPSASFCPSCGNQLPK